MYISISISISIYIYICVCVCVCACVCVCVRRPQPCRAYPSCFQHSAKHKTKPKCNVSNAM